MEFGRIKSNTHSCGKLNRTLSGNGNLIKCGRSQNVIIATRIKVDAADRCAADDDDDEDDDVMRGGDGVKWFTCVSRRDPVGSYMLGKRCSIHPTICAVFVILVAYGRTAG